MLVKKESIAYHYTTPETSLHPLHCQAISLDLAKSAGVNAEVSRVKLNFFLTALHCNTILHNSAHRNSQRELYQGLETSSVEMDSVLSGMARQYFLLKTVPMIGAAIPRRSAGYPADPPVPFTDPHIEQCGLVAFVGIVFNSSVE